MKRYLIDTNICIYFLKGKFGLDQRFNSLSINQLYISEITLAELKFGVYNSSYPNENDAVLMDFIKEVQILPITKSLDFYGREKSRLRKIGRSIDEFDLLIGSSAVVNEMILVTNNIKHFQNIQHIKFENWVENM